MGFRDIHHFNSALVAKQLWRFVTCLNLLVNKVMKAEYFPRSLTFEVKKKPTASKDLAKLT